MDTARAIKLIREETPFVIWSPLAQIITYELIDAYDYVLLSEWTHIMVKASACAVWNIKDRARPLPVTCTC